MTLTDSSELILHLRKVFDEIKDDKEKTNKIKDELEKFNVLPGRTQGLISGIMDLNTVDNSLLILLSEKTFNILGNSEIDPEQYFNKRTIKEVLTNYEGEVSERIDFPFTFENVIKGAEDNYLVYSDAKTAKLLYDNKLLQYNSETQRETRQRKSSDGDIIEVPKVIEKSVKEITDLVKKGQMITSMFTLNARLYDGEELEYNEENRTLTIKEGTLLDILDGFHRLNGIVRALRYDSNLNTKIIFNILNYDKGRAIEQFAQINTTNPVDKGHLKKKSKKTYAPTVLEYIKYNSELKTHISNSVHVSSKSTLIVSENVLLEAIDEVYAIKDKPEAIRIAKYLSEFINELVMNYPEEFLRNIVETKNTSILNSNSMFYGYILLSKRMLDNDIDLSNLTKILNKIDFSKENKVWKKNKILDESHNINRNVKNKVYKFFSELKI